MGQSDCLNIEIKEIYSMSLPIDAGVRFLPQHLDVFVQTRFRRQPAFNNESPYVWAEKTLGIKCPTLAKHPMDRFEVQEFCRQSDNVLDAYLAVMAWGAQGKGPGGSVKARTAWSQAVCIRANLEQLRREKLSRREAYEIFDIIRPIQQLGPAYFTKLLYFFAPERAEGPDRFIMDQWTSLSINLLTGENIVRIQHSSTGNTGRRQYALSPLNKADNYEAFCIEVEELALLLNTLDLGHLHTGEDVEQMLFSLGSMSGPNGRGPREPWRAYVHANWESHRPKHRYRHDLILARKAVPVGPYSC